MRTITYTYKDSHRDWWKLEISNPDYLQKPECADMEWEYSLCRLEDSEGEYRLFFSGDITGVYDIPPSVAEVMSDICHRMTHLAIGFAMYGKEI